MRKFFASLASNAYGSFRGRMILWHLSAIALTIVIVTTDLDWKYYLATRDQWLVALFFPAIMFGSFLPIILPIILWTFGKLAKSAKAFRTGSALAQAAILGSLISSAYKAFTGRIHPPSFRLSASSVDISHGFRFGFLKGGIFWGWPSSHTAIAFAMAVTVATLYPKSRTIRFLALSYAFYVGISVSVSIHWLSEFVAGALIGSAIGLTVGRSFRQET